MTEPDDPPRLLDDAGEPSELRHLLRSARQDVGTDAEVARLAARLGPLLGAGAVASVGGGAAVSYSATKLAAVALALLAAAGGTVWLATRPSAPPPHVPAPPRVAVPVEVAPPVALPSVVAAPVAPSAATSATATATARLDKPAQLSEAELLEQARAALKSDPSRALQRANEHARRFPRGALVQEREVLAIQALRRLGRDAEAERRAEAFAKAFPGSAFQRQMKPNP